MVESHLRPVAGEGEFALQINDIRGAKAASSGLKRPHRADAFGNTCRTFMGNEMFPRPGSFEVSVSLVNRDFQRQ